MANVVIMPQIGLNETSNLISTWNVEVGEEVKIGDILFSIETDKSSMEVESEFEGILLKKLYEEGDACDVLTPVGIIGQKGEDIKNIIFEEKSVNENEMQQEDTVTENTQKSVTLVQTNRDGVSRISPRAKNLGSKKGLNLEYAVGTGPEGRIIERDIYSLLENGPVMTKAAGLEAGDVDASLINATGLGGKILTKDIGNTVQQETSVNKDEYKVVKLTNIRKLIAKNMMQSLQSTAQLTLSASFDATSIMEYRKIIKSSTDNFSLANITLNDMVMYAISRTVNNFENLNAHMINEEEIKIFTNVHLGFACDTDKGLMVPTIFNSNNMTLNEISQTSKELATACQKGNIDPSKLQNATFTVSNLGNFGIENFTPVLNPPQTGILGVGSIEYRVKKVGSEFVEYPAMMISLTFDHRAIDGAPAARFIQELKNNLENFYLLLAK
ncbi:2-oxo acid dehydrogenase subunit E2 [Alkalibaculum sp. M08DMB]|uniref:Dihydrolipoamide acetyltransferase component of pyruvate dehydrogenase complex n=1 Tax=Alkalibaculum sporogenes TaxID=2655001 RepID=A0A6A7K7K4_9FIRM|nr:dihydrolipoamide acetyltransferase family protein [Alkalibaculum sporogenes]MPW25400.1 2-oxo acid dehydrogenase subunit E2 [Alkalibaculum sporogenes]